MPCRKFVSGTRCRVLCDKIARRMGFMERPAAVVAMKERLNPCSRRSSDLEALLRAMREMIGDVTESEVRATITWARESKFISV